MNTFVRSLLGLLLAASTAVSLAATVYTYDELNRLTKVVYDDGRSISYSYDAAGNLLTTVKTAGTSAWCGQTLNFAGNQLPAGWQQVKVRSGPGIVNQRLEGSPTDSGAEVGSPAGPVTAGTNRVVAKFRVNTANSSSGQQFGVSYQLASGRVVYTSLSQAVAYGNGNMLMMVQDLSDTWGSLAATGTVFSRSTLPGYRHGLQEVTMTAQDGQMSIRVKNRDSPVIGDINFAAALPVAFRLADVRKALFNVYTTTGSPIWGDDVEWQCLSAPAAASGSVQVNARDPQGATLSLPNGVNSCTFNATGLWSYGAFPATGPDGVASFNAVGYTRLLESANWFSLIARIGTGYQSIGSSRTVAVNGAASIALMINEGIGLGDSYADNSGSLSVAYTCQ